MLYVIVVAPIGYHAKEKKKNLKILKIKILKNNKWCVDMVDKYRSPQIWVNLFDGEKMFRDRTNETGAHALTLSLLTHSNTAKRRT